LNFLALEFGNRLNRLLLHVVEAAVIARDKADVDNCVDRVLLLEELFIGPLQGNGIGVGACARAGQIHQLERWMRLLQESGEHERAVGNAGLDHVHLFGGRSQVLRRQLDLYPALGDLLDMGEIGSHDLGVQIACMWREAVEKQRGLRLHWSHGAQTTQ